MNSNSTRMAWLREAIGRIRILQLRTTSLRLWNFRAVRSTNAPRVVFAFGLAFAILFVGAAPFELEWAIRVRANLDENVRRLSLAPARMEDSSASAVPSQALVDFSSRFRAKPDARSFLSQLQRGVADGAGIALGAVQRQDQPGTSGQLARTDLTVNLRGNYPAIKLLLMDALERFPGATLSQWRMRRTAQPGDVEATVVIAIWGAANGLGTTSLATRSDR